MSAGVDWRAGAAAGGDGNGSGARTAGSDDRPTGAHPPGRRGQPPGMEWGQRMTRGYYRELPVTISMAEAADTLGLSKQTIRRLIDRGELASIEISGRMLVLRTEIDRLVTEALEQQVIRRAAEAELSHARGVLHSLPARRRARRAAGL